MNDNNCTFEEDKFLIFSQQKNEQNENATDSSSVATSSHPEALKFVEH